MVAGDQVHGNAGAAQQVCRLLNQYPLHPIVLEDVAGQEDEIYGLFPGQSDDPTGGFKPFGTDSFSGSAHLNGLHAQLPVCRMEEFHDFDFGAGLDFLDFFFAFPVVLFGRALV
jgi:hypothetical protein